MENGSFRHDYNISMSLEKHDVGNAKYVCDGFTKTYFALNDKKNLLT